MSITTTAVIKKQQKNIAAKQFLRSADDEWSIELRDPRFSLKSLVKLTFTVTLTKHSKTVTNSTGLIDNTNWYIMACNES